MVSESVFTGQVFVMAKRLGLLAHHCSSAYRCEGSKGFPDLLLCGSRGLILAELKTEMGETSADQDLWAWTIVKAANAGTEFSPGRACQQTWRPSDLVSGRIEMMMRRIT